MSPKMLNYLSNPLTLAESLSKQPWTDLGTDKGVPETVPPSEVKDVLVDRAAAILLRIIVKMIESREPERKLSSKSRQSTAAPVEVEDVSRKYIELNEELNGKSDKFKKSTDLLSGSTSNKEQSRRRRGHSKRKLSMKVIFSKAKNSLLRSSMDTNTLDNINFCSVSENRVDRLAHRMDMESGKEDKNMPPEVTSQVRSQLREYVFRVSEKYNANSYHNFAHAYHVLLSANKLCFMMVEAAKDENSSYNCCFGLSKDYVRQFCLVFSALIHDAEHLGVPNQQLIDECHPLSIIYNDQSIAENRSLAIAFMILMEPVFEDLRSVLFPTTEDFTKFRKCVIEIVLATDIGSGERQQIVASKWSTAFGKLEKDAQKQQQVEDGKTKAVVSQSHQALLNKLQISSNEPLDSSSSEEEDEDDDFGSEQFDRIAPLGNTEDTENRERRHTMIHTKPKLSVTLSHDENTRRMSMPVSMRRSRNVDLKLGIKGGGLELTGGAIKTYSDEDLELKSSVVLELMMKTADVSSQSQGFDTYVKHSTRLFDEFYRTHSEGRGFNPANQWFENQISFFNKYVMPLANRMDLIGVFGESGDIFFVNCEHNRQEWIKKGVALTKEVVNNAESKFSAKPSTW